MTTTPPKYWFPAKRYGWGWGIPSTWQGWTTMIVWIVVMSLTAWIIAAAGHLFLWPIAVLLEAAAFVAICWWKGEPPRWRWGD